MLLNPSSQDNSHDNSDASSSMFGTSPVARSDRSRSPRRSFASSNNGQLDRTPSNSSSVLSMQSNGRSQTFPASLMMTPANRNNDRSESIADSERTASKSTKSNEGGFVASTFGRLKKKERESSPSLSGGQGDDTEEMSKKKKGLKTILGGLNKHAS